jgi:hypothetical protein
VLTNRIGTRRALYLSRDDWPPNERTLAWNLSSTLREAILRRMETSAVHFLR